MVLARARHGFTIVELLIVIVVIAILAAITIVAYTGVLNKANDSVVQSDLAAFAKKAELFYADNARYPITAADLSALGYKATLGSYMVNKAYNNFLYCKSSVTNPVGDQYALVAMSRSGKIFSIDSISAKINVFTGSYYGQGNVCNTFTNSTYPSGLAASGNFWGYLTAGNTWASWTQGT